MKTEDFLNYARDKYPTLDEIYEDDEKSLYTRAMTLEKRRGSTWISDVQPYADLELADKELGNSAYDGLTTLAKAGSLGIDLSSMPDFVKDGYNNSLLGMYEQAANGKVPYELSQTYDKKTGEYRKNELGTIEAGLSFVTSMFMPADMISFALGGGIAAKIGSKTLGNGIRKTVNKKLVAGYMKETGNKKVAQNLARKKTNEILNKPALFRRDKPLFEHFTDLKTGKTFTKKIFDNKDLMDSWQLHANQMGGSLLAHGTMSSYLSKVSENGTVDEQGNYIPGDVDAKDWGNIAWDGIKSYLTGVSVGMVKAYTGGHAYYNAIHKPYGKYVSEGLEYGAESLVFGVADPLLSGRLPTGEDIAHSFFNLASLKIANKSFGSAMNYINKDSRAAQMRMEKLKEEINLLEDMKTRTTDRIILDKYEESILDKKTEHAIVESRKTLLDSDFTNIKSMYEKISKGLDDYDKLKKSGKDDKAAQRLVGEWMPDENTINRALGEIDSAKDIVKQNQNDLIKAGKDSKASKEMLDFEQAVIITEHLANYLIDSGQVSSHSGKITGKKNNHIYLIKQLQSKEKLRGGGLSPKDIIDAGYAEHKVDKGGGRLYILDNEETLIKDTHSKKEIREMKKNPVLVITSDQMYENGMAHMQQKRKDLLSKNGQVDIMDKVGEVGITNLKNDTNSLVKNMFNYFTQPIQGKHGGKNQAITSFIIKENIGEWNRAQSTLSGYLSTINAFANWLSKGYDTDLSFSNITDPFKIKNIIDTYEATGSKGGKAFSSASINNIRSSLGRLYGNGTWGLSLYLPDRMSPVKGTRLHGLDTKRKSFIMFRDQNKALKTLVKKLETTPDVKIDGVSKKHGITNKEWSLFHRLAYRMNADMGEIVRNLVGESISTDNGRVYFLRGKTSGNYDQMLKDKKHKRHDPKLYDDLIDWVNEHNFGAKDQVFPNIFKLADKDKRNWKQGVLESLQHSWGDKHENVDAHPVVFFERGTNVKYGDTSIKPGQFLDYGQEGTTKSSFNKLWRKFEKGEFSEEELKHQLAHKGSFTWKHYQSQQFNKKISTTKDIDKQHSKFVDDNRIFPLLDSNAGKNLIKEVKKKNPNIKFGEGVDKGSMAQTEFRATSALIKTELGLTSIKDVFHEVGEVLFKTAQNNPNSSLGTLFNRGIKLTEREAKIEWTNSSKLRKGYNNNFELFKKEWFIEQTAKLTSNRYMEKSLKARVSNTMKELYVEFKKLWLGVDSDKLDVNDIMLLVGRRGFSGLTGIQNLGYVGGKGEVVYSKFLGKTIKENVDADKRILITKIMKVADKSKLTNKQIFDNLNWKDRFNIKSFSEIKTKEQASILLEDMKRNLEWDKIGDNFYQEKQLIIDSEAKQWLPNNWKSKKIDIKDISTFRKSFWQYAAAGEKLQLLLPSDVIIAAYGGKHGLKLMNNHLLPLLEMKERLLGSITLLKDVITQDIYGEKVTKNIFKGTANYLGFSKGSGALEFIGMYDPLIRDMLLGHPNKNKAEKAANFYKEMLKDGTKENLASKAVKKFYNDTWKLIENTIYENFAPRDADKMVRKLKKEKNYFTHSLSSKFKDFIAETEEGQQMFNKLVENHIYKSLTSGPGRDKEFSKIQGQKRDVKKTLKGKELESKLKELDDIGKARVEELMMKKPKNGQGLSLYEKTLKSARDQINHSSKTMFNPNIDFMRLDYDKSGYHTKDNGKKIAIWESSFDGSVVKYGQNQAKWISALKYAPEALNISNKVYKKNPIADAISEISKKNDRMGEHITRIVEAFIGHNFITNKKREPLNFFQKGMLRFSKFSAAAGLSSAMSGIKNIVLGETTINTAYGFRGTFAGIRGMFNPELALTAKMFGLKAIGGHYLEEIGATSIIAKGGFMEPTEWSNRLRSAGAVLAYVDHGLGVLKGEKKFLYDETLGKILPGNKQIETTFLRKLKDNFHWTNEDIAFAKKYGLHGENLPNIKTKNYKKLKAKQEEILGRTIQYGHKTVQGSTGVLDLPVWASGNYAKWSTVFYRIAASQTRNWVDNVWTPLLSYKNPLPMLRYGASTFIGGYAMWQISDWLLGQEAPHESMDDATSQKLLEYGYKAELGQLFSAFISPYDRGGDYGIIGEYTPVNFRNMEAIAMGIINFKSGNKYLGQSLSDTATNILVSYNHAQRILYKQTHPYLTKHKKIRQMLGTYAQDNDLLGSYSGNYASLSSRSPLYRKLRHTFMIDKLHGQDGFVAAYWSAVDWIATEEARKTDNRFSRSVYISWAEKAVNAKVRTFDPVHYSENTDKGRFHIDKFMKSLNKENAFLVRKMMGDFKVKKSKYMKEVELYDKYHKISKY